MGRSAIAGWGLVAGEKVKAGQFLGVRSQTHNLSNFQEYKGEIIGNEESERRGLLYDKKGVSFLFTLNKGSVSLSGLYANLSTDQVVDATRAANKFRFVNGVHRIGMYAKTDLYPGQELFFDYGYNSKSTKFVPLEHQVRPKDSKIRVKLAGRTTKGSSKQNKSGAHNVQRVKRIDDEDEESDLGSESFEESEESD